MPSCRADAPAAGHRVDDQRLLVRDGLWRRRAAAACSSALRWSFDDEKVFGIVSERPVGVVIAR